MNYSVVLHNNLRICYTNLHYWVRHNLRAKKLYFKKTHPRGKSCKYYTSRVLYIPFHAPKLQIFGAKPLPRRRFLQHYYRGTPKTERWKVKTENWKPPKAHRYPTDLLVLFYACADSSKWGLFRALRSECVPSHSFRSRNLQYAYPPKMKKWLFIQITPINHHFTNQNLHICDIFCTFAGKFGYNYNFRRNQHDSF